MSAEKTYTEREVVLRERAAFKAGAYRAHFDRLGSAHSKSDGGMYLWKSADSILLNDDRAMEAAADAYPLPKVTRPRVVKDSDGDEWRWSEAKGLEMRCDVDGAWYVAEGHNLAVPSVRALVADLLANPTEEVEDAS